MLLLLILIVYARQALWIDSDLAKVSRLRYFAFLRSSFPVLELTETATIG